MDGACSKYGESRGVYRVLVGNRRDRDNLEDPAVDVSLILIFRIFRFFRKWDSDHVVD